jgi:hypothetical protein
MAGRFARSWSLMKQSWEVLKLDKELLVFPVLSAVACIIVLVSFVVPSMPALQRLSDGGGEGLSETTMWIAVFGLYVVNYFVIIFFNTALASCALIRFGGGDPTVTDGLKAAAARLPQIFGWALVSATVGFLLRSIEERVQLVGKIVVSLIGTAWTVVTYLVVPILAVERLGPLAAVRRSAELLRRSWGEALVGNVGLGAAGFLLALPAFLVAALAVLSGSTSVMLTLFAVCVLYFVGVSIVVSTLQQVFLAGVYVYATQGTAPEGFSEDALHSAFAPKG